MTDNDHGHAPTDPTLAQAVDEAIVVGDPLADAPEAQPARPIAAADFASFYIRHRSALERHARRYLHDAHDVEDVVQETFIKLFLAVPDLDTELQALAFSRRVLTNLCIDRYRAAKRRPAVIDLEAGTVEQLVADDEPTDPVVQAEDAAIVRQALALLSPLHRSALVLREIEEKSLPTIAAELGVPEDSVKHLLFRARRALRRLLAGSAVDPASPETEAAGSGVRIPRPGEPGAARLAKALVNAGHLGVVVIVFIGAGILAGVTGVVQSAFNGPHTIISDGDGGTSAIGPGVVGPTGAGAATTSHHNGPRSSGSSHSSSSHASVSHPTSSGSDQGQSPTSTTTTHQPTPTHHAPAGGPGGPVTHAPTHAPFQPRVAPPVTLTPVEGGRPISSPSYTVGGSITPTGPVTIGNQQRINYGVSAVTSVSQLSAPVGGDTFTLGQALISSGSSAAQMQLTPQLLFADGTSIDEPATVTSTSVTLDSAAMVYLVDVIATLGDQVGQPSPAAVQIDLQYDAGLSRVLAETVTVSNLNLGTGGAAAPTPPGIGASGAGLPVGQATLPPWKN